MIVYNGFFKVPFAVVLILLISVSISCQNTEEIIPTLVKVDPSVEIEQIVVEPEEKSYKLADIDLNHWKVTLPIGNPTEVLPPEILEYGTNETLKPFMYNDSINGAIVFYAYPKESTANSSYSRTELRELMKPEDKGATNWTFKQGGNLKGVLSMGDVSKDSNDDYHRVIIMQIHGRLTNTQRDLIGQKDNNAPPMLKIYWVNGKVRVKTKVLKDLKAVDAEILKTDAWGDDEGFTFPEYVGFDKFMLEVKVSDGRMEVILNETATRIYEDIHIQKWGVFENYFKAGNYLVSKDKNAFSKVKYYELEVSHE